jgi:hypothetical protein
MWYIPKSDFKMMITIFTIYGYSTKFKFMKSI